MLFPNNPMCISANMHLTLSKIPEKQKQVKKFESLKEEHQART
jgi:hypothetical protein